MKPWYEKLFENYANSYESENFTLGTTGECDFIEKEAGFNKQLKILDIGCGTGRHSIEMAKRGYNMTGVDLSENMLGKAREKAKEQKLSVVFQQHDARNLPFDREFDLAIMLCEGGFPLMETDEMNYRILQSAAGSLNDGGKLIFTTLNGLFPLFHSVKEFLTPTPALPLAGGEGENGTDGFTRRSPEISQPDNTFDLMTFRDHNKTVLKDDNGNDLELDCNERYYVPSEITWLLKSLGFKKIDIFGAKLGMFSREDKLTTEDFEMLVVAEGLEQSALCSVLRA